MAEPVTTQPDAVPAADSLEHFDTKGRPFPIFSVAVVQSETEMLHAPAHNLAPMLVGADAINHTLFTERTFTQLFDPDTSFDCIVIGHNAIHESAALLRALTDRLPDAGLCILHQHGPRSLDFLAGDIGLRIEPREHDLGEVEVAAGLIRNDEILLNWPHPVGTLSGAANGDGSDGRGRRIFDRRSPARAAVAGDAPALAGEALMRVSAVRVLRPTPDSEWRTICEVSHDRRRLPVLVRTRMTRRPRVAATTMMFEPGDEQHRAVLLNMITWCAGGRPEVAVVHSGDDEQPSKIVRKLWMQGSHAIRHEARRSEDAHCRAWPLRGVSDIVVTNGTELEGTDAWLRGGGRLIHLEEGGLRIAHRQSDARWVMQRWAAWFTSVPAAVWHGGHAAGVMNRGSVFAMRAVLWTLRELRRRDAEEFGDGWSSDQSVVLPAPEEYARPVADALRRRFGSQSHLERTISQTVAAIDVDDLLGGKALTSSKRAQVEAWLWERVDDPEVAPDNKLDILRALAPNGRGGHDDLDLAGLRERAHDTYRRIGPTISAVLMTKIREAAIQLDAQPSEEVVKERKWSLDVDPELDTSLLLASEYLIALHEYGNRGWKDPEQIEVKRATIDRALMTIARYGRIQEPKPAADAATAELISTEARALMVYFDAEPTPAHGIARDSTAVSPQQLVSVLRESERLRRANVVTEQYRHSVKFTARILTAGVLLLSTLLVWWVIANVGDLAGVVTPVVAAPFIFGLLLVLLESVKLGTVTGRRIGRFVLSGTTGLFKGLADRFDRADAEP